MADEATDYTEANWASKTDVAGKPTKADEAEADKANEAEAGKADAKANETGGAIVADSIKANVINKIVAADEAILDDAANEAIISNDAVKSYAANKADLAHEAADAAEANEADEAD